MEAFRTLAGPAEGELKEKGSRFLARVVPVRDRTGAEAFFALEARRFHDATHVVPAFVLHDGTAFASDAGEPAGSAGQPILHAIGGAGLSDVAAVVVRWYGGTKLGVGGLVRAYSAALSLALEGAPTVAAVPAVRLRVRYPHDRTAAVLRAIAGHGGVDLEHGYDDEVTCAFTLPRGTREAFAGQLRGATQGTVSAEEVGVAVIYR